jgi:hypothetical protein
MATPISTLAVNVQNRLEEIPTGAPGAWWSYQFEILSAIIEAQNDLLLLVGRPTQVVNLPFTLVPDTPWQTVPKGVLLITDIQGAQSPLYKINLWDFDYLQTAWGSDWQQDVGPVAYQWAPVGFNMFAVHPAPEAGQTVNITAIQYPTTDVWPYTGAETCVFENQFFELIEEYAAFYCRIKETGGEFQEGLKLFEQYMAGAKRMTQIQDRRDPLLFISGYGAAQRTNPMTMR